MASERSCVSIARSRLMFNLSYWTDSFILNIYNGYRAFSIHEDGPFLWKSWAADSRLQLEFISGILSVLQSHVSQLSVDN